MNDFYQRNVGHAYTHSDILRFGSNAFTSANAFHFGRARALSTSLDCKVFPWIFYLSKFTFHLESIIILETETKYDEKRREVWAAVVDEKRSHRDTCSIFLSLSSQSVLKVNSYTQHTKEGSKCCCVYSIFLKLLSFKVEYWFWSRFTGAWRKFPVNRSTVS